VSWLRSIACVVMKLIASTQTANTMVKPTWVGSIGKWTRPLASQKPIAV